MKVANKSGVRKTLRVLSVEDSGPDMAMITRHLSRAGYELTSERVDTPEAMRAALETQEWDVILCDHSMPNFNALRALELMKEMGLEIPFIIVSGTVGEAVAVEAMRAGAQDYLMKNNLARLAPTIERELYEAENRRARRRAEQALKSSEGELRRLFEAMTDVILVFDSEGRHLEVAPTNHAHVYVQPTDRIGKTVHDLFPKPTADLFLACIRAALLEGETQKLEYSLVIQGQEIWFDASVSPFSGDTALWIARDITERKHAEEQLRHHLDFNEAIATSLGEGVYALDLSGRVTFMNPAAEGALGWSEDELLGQHMHEVIHFQHADGTARAAHECPLLEVLHSGQCVQIESDIFIRKDGTMFPVSYTSSPIITNGQVIGAVLAFHDITEREQAEEALRESETRYRLLFESNPVPMWVYDLQTLGFLAVNDAAILHYGYSREKFRSMTIKDIRPPEEIPALLENVSRVGGGMNEPSIWKHRKKDGTTIDVEVTSHELVFAGRHAELVLANDVTERTQVEAAQTRRVARTALRADINAALAESQVSLQTILEHSSEAIVKHLDATFAGIWTLNKEGEVLELQTSAGEDTPIDEQQARVSVGTFKIGVIAKERRPHLTNEVQNDPAINDKEWAVREGMIAFAGYPLIVEDRLVGVMAMFARHKLTEGTIDALASAADIISQAIERKRAEEALRQSEEQLRQSQKLEAVGQLAGGIAHDFNNLLTVINGYSELAIRRLQPEDALIGSLEEIKRAGTHAASLTRQLLAFSRKQVLQPRVLNLNVVISDLEKMLQRLIGEDVDLRTVLKPELKSVNADPGQIEQVIMNLVVNARDAMPDGGRLIIQTENVYLTDDYAMHHVAVRPGPYVMLAVSDNGSGMNDETKTRLFEPFFTTKEKDKGTGLGLSTVYGIVKQSMGNIWVYSEEGLGTTFKVYLPCVDDEVDDRQPSQTSLLIARGSETILLVEDDEMVRGLTRTTLEEGGYKVLQAANGLEALLICEQYPQPIHLLLTDVVMPGMSGRAVADRLKTLRPQMLVLYMSGYTEDAIVHHGVLNAGVNFIEKPFAPAALTGKLRELLDAG